jgi:hypothetical protein
MLQASDTHVGVEPADSPPRVKRIVLPLIGGEIERHVLALTAALARAAHAEVLLVAADSVTIRGTARIRQFGFGARPATPTMHAASRNLARNETALRGRGVRVRSYLVRGGAVDVVELVGRVAPQERASIVVLPTGPRAEMSVQQAAWTALAMAVPTLLVSTDAANPWTHDILQATSVIVPTVTCERATEGLLWAETLAKCCGGSIIMLRLGHLVDTMAQPIALPAAAPAANKHGPSANADHEDRATWPASGVTIRSETVAEFGPALAHLRLHAPALVVVQCKPAQLKHHSIQAVFRALDATGVLTLVVPWGVTPSPITDDMNITAAEASGEESRHDATTHP